MPPKRIGSDFKTVRVVCNRGHEVAKYRKPRAEWGEQTHKLWLVPERLGRLVTEPPILDSAGDLNIPDTGELICCGAPECNLEIGKIAMVKGTVALVLNKSNIRRTKG